jgi:hypothetical protein
MAFGVRTKRLTAVAIVVSITWAALVVSVVIAKWGNADDMSMNAWGDFLAGVTAPLALFWLIIGYFQQGKELALNTKALEEQVRETRALAQHADRQAAAAETYAKLVSTEQLREQYRETIEARPILQSRGGTQVAHIIHTEIVNLGGEMRDIRVRFLRPQPHKLSLTSPQFLGRDETSRLDLSLHGPVEWPLGFELTFTNKLHQQQILRFELHDRHRLHEVPFDAEAEQL